MRGLRPWGLPTCSMPLLSVALSGRNFLLYAAQPCEIRWLYALSGTITAGDVNYFATAASPPSAIKPHAIISIVVKALSASSRSDLTTSS